MTTVEEFRSLAISVRGATELPHFEKTSFRIGGKIYATLDVNKMIGCLKLSRTDQQSFSLANTAVYPVPNKWGETGWTNVDLKLADEELVSELIKAASRSLNK